MSQRFADLALLQRKLIGVGQLLESAAAALVHVRAPRGDASGGSGLECGETGLGETPVRLRDTGHDAVAGEPAVHEHHLALDAGQRLAAERNVHDVEG